MNVAGPIPRERFYVAGAVAAAALILYVKTLCGDIFWQDSGLYNRSVGLLGSGVPPGFPSYHLLCYLFTMLPGVAAIVGMNLFSAVAGAASAFFIVLLVYEVTDDGPARAVAAAAATLAYIAAPTIWLQSTTAEVYTLNMALTAATVLALFAWRRRRDARWLYAAAFIYGLACANHPQQAVLLVPYVVFVVWNGRRGGLRAVHVAPLAALWLFAMSTYLYLPVRSAAGVAMDWGRPRTLYGLYFHLTAKEFQRQMFSAPWAVIIWRVKSAAWLYLDQFTWLGVAVAAVGAFRLARRRWRDFVYFVLLAAFTLFLTVNYPSFGFRAWYFTFYMLTAVCIGVAVAWGTAALARRRRAAAYAFAATALVVALAPIPARFYRADRTYYPYARDFSANQLRSIGYEDMLFLGEENSGGTGGIEALTTLEYARADITLVDTTGNSNYLNIFDFAGEDLEHAPNEYVATRYYQILNAVVADPRRDYYFLYPYDYFRLWGYGLAEDGLVYRLVRPGGPAARADLWRRYYYRGVVPATTYLDAWAQSTIGNFFYNMSEAYRRGDERRAEEYLRVAARVGWRSNLVQHNVGTVYYLRGDYRRAAPFFETSLRLDPTASLTRYLLAECYKRLGRPAAARAQLETLLRYDANFKAAAFTLRTGTYVR